MKRLTKCRTLVRTHPLSALLSAIWPAAMQWCVALGVGIVPAADPLVICKAVTALRVVYPVTGHSGVHFWK